MDKVQDLMLEQLFIIYINDLNEVINTNRKCNIVNYADDTNIIL